MKISRLFLQTLRSSPAEAMGEGNQFMQRAGYIHQHASGSISLMPLGARTLQKLDGILKREVEAIGGQELLLLNDPYTGDYLPDGMNEIIELTRARICSHRQLPQIVYHMQKGSREGAHARSGLLNGKESWNLVIHTLDISPAGHHAIHQAVKHALERVLSMCDLPWQTMQSESGSGTAESALGYYFATALGPDAVATCVHCGYAADSQVARFQRQSPESEPLKEIVKAATPHAETIQQLAGFLGIPAAKTAKAVFYMAGYPSVELPIFIFAVVRGDMEVSESKLTRMLGASSLRPATTQEILAVGAVPGYASPIGMPGSGSFKVVVDEMIPLCANLAAGANEDGYHLLNTNYPRDYQADLVGDIASIQPGYACPTCGEPMELINAVEFGKVISFDWEFGKTADCLVQDENGNQQPILLSRFSLDYGKILGCMAEANHDERGMCLSASLAPFQAQLVVLPGKGLEVLPVAEQLYTDLQAAGLEVLYDDRVESPGVKFNDADLIGCPLRLTIGERSLSQGGVELKMRSSNEITIVNKDDIVQEVQTKLNLLTKVVNL